MLRMKGASGSHANEIVVLWKALRRGELR